MLAQESERFSGKVYGVVAFVVVFHLNKNIQDWDGVLDFWRGLLAVTQQKWC